MSLARRVRRLEDEYAAHITDPNDRRAETPENAVWMSELLINWIDHFDELHEEYKQMLRFVLGDNGFTEERFREFVVWQMELYERGELHPRTGWDGEYHKIMGLEEERSAVLRMEMPVFACERDGVAAAPSICQVSKAKSAQPYEVRT